MNCVSLLVRDPIKLVGRSAVGAPSHQIADWVAGKPCSFPSLLPCSDPVLLNLSFQGPRLPEAASGPREWKEGADCVCGVCCEFSYSGQLLVWNESGDAGRVGGSIELSWL
jgi:hypothetical protein